MHTPTPLLKLEPKQYVAKVRTVLSILSALKTTRPAQQISEAGVTPHILKTTHSFGWYVSLYLGSRDADLSSLGLPGPE